VSRLRIVAFIALCIVCIAGAVGYAVTADRKAAQQVKGSSAALATPAQLAAVSRQAHVLFRSTAVNGQFGRLGVAAIGSLEHPQWTSLNCERVAFADDRGLCMVANRGAITTYKVVIFDDRFQVLHSVDLPGLPSRARVSADGRYGATTTFVAGDSYAGTNFSTRTELYDMQSGKSLGNLEQFTAKRDGQVVNAVDRNLWGVTFAADSNTFYATLSTGGTQYLVRGDVAARTMTVLRAGVECPSLSPDGTRIAFKKRVSGPLGRVEWRLSVLDVKTLVDHPLAETRSVDDQAEWLNNTTVLYSLPRSNSGTPAQDTWSVRADGTGKPVEFLAGAFSTTVVAGNSSVSQP
jgi:hypothetical protein